jgi:hypothetical protein
MCRKNIGMQYTKERNMRLDFMLIFLQDCYGGCHSYVPKGFIGKLSIGIESSNILLFFLHSKGDLNRAPTFIWSYRLLRVSYK